MGIKAYYPVKLHLILLHFNQSSSLNLVKFLQELIESTQIVELLLDLLPKALIQQLLCFSFVLPMKEVVDKDFEMLVLLLFSKQLLDHLPKNLQLSSRANDPTTTLDDVDEGVDHHLA